MNCYLYRVTHRETGNSYLGVSINPTKRWGEHCRDALVRPQGKFHRSLGKYGPQAFDWQVIREFASTTEAKLAELCFIYIEEPTLNLTAGGDGNWGYCPTPEARAKISAAQRGRSCAWTSILNARKRGVPQTAEHVEKRVSCFRGKPRNPAAVEKTRKALTGRVHPEDRKRINSEAQQKFQASLTPEERKQRTEPAREALRLKRAAQK